MVVQPWLTPGSHEEKRAHVRPLAGLEFKDVCDTAWEVTAVADEHKQAAVETQDRVRLEASPTKYCHLVGDCNLTRFRKVLSSLDGNELTDSSIEVHGHGSLGDTGVGLKAADEMPQQEKHSSHEVGSVGNDKGLHQANAEATELADSVAAEARYDDRSPELVTGNAKSIPGSPRLEPSPLFAHECLTPKHEEAEVYLRDPDNTATAMEEQTGPLDECYLEMFPSDREHILQRIETTKSRLDEDETSSHGTPSPTHFPAKAVAKSSPSSNASSPQLESIKEEGSSDKIIAPPLQLSDPTQAREKSYQMRGAEASRQYSRSKEDSGPTTSGDSDTSGYSSVSEERAPPIAAHNKVLHSGLAALGGQHKSIEESPSRQRDQQFAPPDVDGPADIGPTSRITSKLKDQSPTLSRASVLGQRDSMPGSFVEHKEDKHRRSSLHRSASTNAGDASSARKIVADGGSERKAPGNRALTPTSLTSGIGGKHENFFQAFWRVVFVDLLGPILAQLFGRGRGKD